MAIVKLVIMGAHSAVGRAFAEALEDRDVGAEVVLATTLEHLEDGLDLVQETTFQGADLVFVADDNSFTRKLVEGADRMSAPVIDLAVGVGASRGRLLWPLLADRALTQQPGLYRLPMGCEYGVVTVLQLFRRWMPRRVKVVTFEGAAAAGQPGIDELSALTRGVFSQQSTDSEVFYAPAAFNILPSVNDEEDPFGEDRRLEASIREGLDLVEEPQTPSVIVEAVRTRVPVFTAEGVYVDVQCDEVPSFEDVQSRISSARGLRLASTPGSSTMEAVDRDDALVSRLRVTSSGVELWLSFDRLRHGAAWPAVVLSERYVS